MSNEQIESTEGSETCTGLTMGYLAQKYTEWCKDTKRNGSVLIGGSMLDFFKWLTSQRAAFIKGCQYAATAFAVSREDAEKNPYPESIYPQLDNTQIGVATMALKMCGVGAERYVGNIGRMVWDQAVKAVASAKPVAGLQWVKASERLPETEDEAITIIPVFFRRKGNKYAGTFSDMAFWAYSVCFNQSHYDEVEWLDESSPSQQSFHS